MLRNSQQVNRRFKNLLQAFQHCDPAKSAFINSQELFAEVAAELAQQDEAGGFEAAWSQLDKDGNGQVSFPEFVEWAESEHVDLPTGIPGDGGSDGLLTFPKSWHGPRDDPMYCQCVEIEDNEHVSELQAMLEVSYKNVWTRDRRRTGRKDVPLGFKLHRVQHAESYRQWRGYFLKRHLLTQKIVGIKDFVQHEARTGKLPQLNKRHGLRRSCNEWLLFHGTSHDRVEAILRNDFSMSFAGSSTGSLYGQGIYFADSITKADEYSVPDVNDLCCVLVCRVLGGHVLYSDAVKPDAADLQRKVLDGGFHSILGDRESERCRKTYKEFVVFDAKQIYVEYVMVYERRYS